MAHGCYANPCPACSPRELQMLTREIEILPGQTFDTTSQRIVCGCYCHVAGRKGPGNSCSKACYERCWSVRLA